MMDHIRPIWTIIEGRRHRDYNLHTYKDIHGDTLPQHHKWNIYVYSITYRTIYNLSTSGICVSTISSAEERGRDRLQ